MPSMQAPASPRRPTRRRQRTRLSLAAISFTASRGAVRRIVVDENRFPGDAGQCRIQPAH